MAQPIREHIKETYGEKEQPIYTLLVDGNSLLFMCMKDNKINAKKEHYGGVYQFLLQLRMQYQKKDFDYVYVFFDDEFSGLLRWQIYNQYKANRDKNYADYDLSDYMKQFNATVRKMQEKIFAKQAKERAENGKEINATKSKSTYEKFIDENFLRERDLLCKYFNELYIRWEIDEVCEGDDMISYYCANKKPNEKIVIMTGDMDISQLLADDICIYDLHKKVYITNKNYKSYYGFPCENIMVKKVFCGDTSDNISNIAGLSEEKFFEIMPEAKERKVTISEVKERAQRLINERVEKKAKPYKVHENIVNGASNKQYDGDFYEINEKIIDLLHPLMTDTAKESMDAMMYAPQDPEGRSFINLYKMLNEDGIDEIRTEGKFASFFNIFKRLEEKEKKYYEKCLKE